jgi:lipopolysaccharide export system ATP-binding protein
VSELQQFITRLKVRGIGVLLTDHNVRETFAICDRAYIITDGRVICHGPPNQIVNDPQVRRNYLGENFRMPARDGDGGPGE